MNSQHTRTQSRQGRFAVRRLLHGLEDGILAALVLTLVAVAGGQILLRLFWQTGLDWADGLLRALILWTALIGAMVAAREDKHLKLDALARWLHGPALWFSRFLAQGFAAAISALLAWYSISLVQLERESQTVAFGLVPTWITQLIMPVSFAIISLRFGLRALGLARETHTSP